MKTKLVFAIFLYSISFVGCQKKEEIIKIEQSVKINDKKTNEIPFWTEIKWGMSQSELKSAMTEKFYKVKIFDKKFVDGFVKINGIEHEISFAFKNNKLETFKAIALTSLSVEKIDIFRSEIVKELQQGKKLDQFNGSWSLDNFKPNDNTEISIDIKRDINSKKQMVEITIQGIWFGHYMGPE